VDAVTITAVRPARECNDTALDLVGIAHVDRHHFQAQE